MTHAAIRTLLAFRDAPGKKCDEVNALLDEHIGHVAWRIGELRVLERVLERELKELRGQGHVVPTARDCGIMQSLGRNSGRATKANDNHGQLRRTHR